jgi:hypothetical protein
LAAFFLLTSSADFLEWLQSKEKFSLANKTLIITPPLMTKTFAAVLTSAVLALNSANAAIVFGNLGDSGSGTLGAANRTITANAWMAVGFTPAGLDLMLNTATLGLAVSSAGSATIRLDLYTGVSAPDTASSFFNTSLTLPANTTAQKISFDLSGTTLNAGTTYWLGLRKTSLGGGTVTWLAPVGATPPLPTGLNGSGWANVGANTIQRTTNSGGAWNAAASPVLSLSIDASPIPEPGTWAAMAIFAGGAAYVGWRRRQQQLA